MAEQEQNKNEKPTPHKLSEAKKKRAGGKKY